MNKNIIRIILIVLLIATLVRIFIFSNQSGKESRALSRRITIAITQNIKSIQDLDYNERDKALDKIEKFIRKLAHFSLYTLVGIFTMAFMSACNMKKKRQVLTSILVGILCASFDELHQYFVSERTALFTDVLIDTAGVCLGVLIVLVTLQTYIKIRKKRQKSIEIT